MARVIFDGVTKRFAGGVEAVKDLNMEVTMKRRKPGYNHNADINTSQNDLSSDHSVQSMVSGLNFHNFKMSWLVYGAAAYYGLKLLSRRGFLPSGPARRSAQRFS